MIFNDEVNGIIRKKIELIRQHDTHQIEEEEYLKKLGEYDLLIKEKNRKMVEASVLAENDKYEKRKAEQERLAHLNTTMPNKIKMEAPNMADEKKVEVKAEKPKKESKRTNSNAALIIKALTMKSTKTLDDVVKKVVEWNPNAIEKNIKGQTSSIIKMIKSGHKRFLKYAWDEGSFSVTEKQ
jgi:septal ring factor EnvC (AmiA/AmiB activator)